MPSIMSPSPDASHRARLIREMSRDLNRPNRSDAYAVGSDHGSIPDSTVSDFDPDNEALMSTRQLDNTTNRLPELRASAKKFGRRNNPEVDFVMNTSAIEKAFPDFSMPGSSSDEGSDSIEIGRGGKKPAKGAYRGLGASREFSSNVPFSVGNDSVRSSKAMIESFEVLSTPPARPRMTLGAERGSLRQNAHTKRASPSQKENQDPSPPPAKTSDYVSNGSKSNSSRERRTLTELHARVTSEDDGSLVSEERPPTVNLTARNSRFVNARNRQSSGASGAGGSIPSKFANTEDFLQGLTQGTGANRNSHNPQAARAASAQTGAASATQQSFLLPDLPNLSELVSGVFNDGTPVFSRSGKPRSRFASSTFPRGSGNNKPDHIPIDSIPVPEEERAIFVSLRLLQDKLAELENEKAEVERRAEELKGENDVLKAQRAEQERLRRSDSALGMADSGSDAGESYGKRNGNWIVEKLKLESTMKSLQSRLDTTNRKVSVSEVTMKNLTQERDSAVSQLEVAYYTSEGLKAENEALKAENETLKTRLAQIGAERENETKNWSRKEAALKKKVERREEAVREVREMTREIWELRQDGEAQTGGGKRKGKGTKRQSQVDTRGSGLENRKSGAPVLETNGQERKVIYDARKPSSMGGKTTTSNPVTRGREVSGAPSTVAVENPGVKSRSRSRRRPSTTVDSQEIQKKKRTRQVVVEEMVETDSSDQEQGQEQTGSVTGTRAREEETDESLYEISPRPRAEGARDSTYLGFLEVGNVLWTRSDRVSNFDQDAEIVKMRKTLEDERAAHRKRTAAAAEKGGADTVRAEKPIPQPALPRKSSMKDLTANSKTGRLQSGDDEHTGRYSVKVGENAGQVSDDETTRSRKSTIRRRHHSDTSVISRTSVRRRIPADEMTSAFIVPDITLRGLPVGKEAEPVLSPAAQHVLGGLAQHSEQNCIICRRITSHDHERDGHTVGGEKVKDFLRVPKPIPVSERMPQASEWNEEPTVRPSQPPVVALAVVMKGLEDELSHLKMELARYQSAYNSHDASLSKRKRKSIFTKIESLLREIDAKADQIYALYDVLEGQKADGHEITEEEVEVTLHSIGINPVELGLRGHDMTNAKRNRVTYAGDGQSEGSRNSESSAEEEEAHEGGDNGDDDELPWEGIEDTDA
ncbi:hypothetical protein FGG08_005703 [Glutinoglossum americanum]|uniref:Cep57 centrosome microtubule-binding domain-containing protein n=1 Tax=Glutinoglossum americanum TaxID=1670608 RepID=A0A9P8I6P8_9PEZI|nr:hypothetical protein FGG08_005703 [Glutinoglossum americanum]